MTTTIELHNLLLQAADELEPLPTAVIQLAVAVNQPDTGPEELAVILGSDPALAAHVLREANSAASASGVAIGSLDQAVVRLGAARTLEIAIRGHLEGRLSADLPVYQLSGTERRVHAVATSIAAEIVARATRVEVSRDVVCAALLHDMGKDIIDQVATTPHADLLQDVGLPVMEIERELVQADHAEVGALVLSKWGLPETIVLAVNHHHRPTESPEAAVVCLAEGLTSEFLDSGEIETADDPGNHASAAAFLRLEDELPSLRDRLGEALEKAGFIDS